MISDNKLYTWIAVKFFLIKEQIKVIRRYYKKWSFLKTDFFLFFLYLFSNPYRTCRKFLQKKQSENVYVYGETPLTTLEKIVRAFHIQSKDKWLDLGSGRGRGCFWIAEFWGCETTGIEWIPSFSSKASWITKWISSSKANFQNSSMEKADFSWPTVVYLCSTCMLDEEIQSLLISMKALSRGTKVITISEPLKHPSYILIHSIPVSFVWGETDAYLHIKYTE